MTWEFPKYAKLEDAVRRFFEILDIKEESGSGKEFHPNRMNFEEGCVSSCRVYNSAELKSVFEQMKELSGYLGIWLFYDPPSGWMYGFPKPYLPKEGESLSDTLRRDGYPEHELKAITKEDGSLQSVLFMGRK